MNKILKSVFISILISLCAIIIYFFIRADSIKEFHDQSLSALHNNVKSTLSGFSDSKTRDETASVVKEISEKNKNILILSFTDTQNNYLGGYSNFSSSEKDSGLSDLIINDIKTSKITSGKIEPRYYGKNRYFVVKMSGNKFNFFAVYRYFLNRNILAAIAFQLSLIIFSSFIIVFSSIYLFFNNKSSSEIPQTGESVAAFNEKTFEIFLSKKFADLSSKTDLIKFMFYLYDNSSRTLHHHYTYEKGILFKIESSDSAFGKKSELISELKKGSPVIKSRSKSVIVPVMENKNLLGALVAEKSKAINGNSLSVLKDLCRNIAYNLIK